MKVRGDLPPSNAFTLEAQPKKPGFVLARFFENAVPFTEERDGLTTSGYEYDEYHLELADTGDLQDDILSSYYRYLSEAKNLDPAGSGPSLLDELSQACNAAIMGGVDVETSQGLEHFSLSTEDQINIQNRALKVAAGAPGVLYHADGQQCRVFSADEITAISDAADAHVTYHTTLHNHLKMWVNRTEDPAELRNIFYGAELPEDLKEHLNELLAGDAS